MGISRVLQIVTAPSHRPALQRYLDASGCGSTPGVHVVGSVPRRSCVGSSRVGMEGTPACGEWSLSWWRGRASGRIWVQKGLGSAARLAPWSRRVRDLRVLLRGWPCQKCPPTVSSQGPLGSPALPTSRRCLQTRIPPVSPWRRLQVQIQNCGLSELLQTSPHNGEWSIPGHLLGGPPTS